MAEKEQTLSESFAITGIGLISLDNDDLEKDDYSFLGPTSNYRITKVNDIMRKKRKRFSLQIKPVLFRKRMLKKKSFTSNH